VIDEAGDVGWVHGDDGSGLRVGELYQSGSCWNNIFSRAPSRPCTELSLTIG
jgi:hypothetical protein